MHISKPTRKHVEDILQQEEVLNEARVAAAKKAIGACDLDQSREEELFGIDKWSPEENHALMTARIAAGQEGKGLDHVVKIMQGMVPERSRDEVVLKWSWHNRKQAARHRWQDAISTWHRERTLVYNECETLLREENELTINRARKQQDALSWEMQQTKLRRKLANLRAARKSKDAENRRKQREEEEIARLQHAKQTMEMEQLQRVRKQVRSKYEYSSKSSILSFLVICSFCLKPPLSNPCLFLAILQRVDRKSVV